MFVLAGLLFADACLPAVSFAQTAAAGSNWDHLKALPVHTKVHVAADKGGHTCYVLSVDDATLACGKYTFARTDVKSVKLTRYSASYAVGAAIGAGAGAGIFVGVNNTQKGNYIAVSSGQAAAAGLLVGGVIGTLVTGPADLLSGPTVYRRQ